VDGAVEALRAEAADGGGDAAAMTAMAIMNGIVAANRMDDTHGCWRPRVAALAITSALLVLTVPIVAQSTRHRTFPTPDAAVKVLIDAVKAGNLDELLAIFGPEGQDLIASSDPATARGNRQVFAAAVAEQWHLEDEGKSKTLVIGNEAWPFPVPLVKDAAGWRFDTAAAKEEVLARRIGRNELETIQTCLAYVTAQRRYAMQGHDGKAAGVYAMSFRSDPGKENGLYWPAARGQHRSPLGDLVAQAAEEGRPLGAGGRPSPLHGYYFKILTAQGSKASGGARTYVVNGDMSGGFALVAWPAEYDVTGIMTFVVNQDGIVREKDLGAKTDALARAMTAHNPDASWRPTP
jgi:hypothetical protein